MLGTIVSSKKQRLLDVRSGVGRSMWTWSRSAIEDFAPLSSVLVIGFICLALWRFSRNDGEGGAWLLAMAGVSAVYAGLGWYFRRGRPEDPWQPR